jgi:hypothetical protein
VLAIPTSNNQKEDLGRLCPDRPAPYPHTHTRLLVLLPPCCASTHPSSLQYLCSVTDVCCAGCWSCAGVGLETAAHAILLQYRSVPGCWSSSNPHTVRLPGLGHEQFVSPASHHLLLMLLDPACMTSWYLLLPTPPTHPIMYLSTYSFAAQTVEAWVPGSQRLNITGSYMEASWPL